MHSCLLASATICASIGIASILFALQGHVLDVHLVFRFIFHWFEDLYINMVFSLILVS